jgi:hypothetical protein
MEYKNGFFIHLSNELTCKNKLQKEILEFLNGLDNLVVKDSDYAELYILIYNQVVFLNQKHHRCKPEKYIVQPVHDWYIYNFDFVKVNMYRIKNTFEECF